MLVEKLEKHAASAGGNFFQNHLIGMRFDKKKNAESVPILVPMPQEVTTNYWKNNFYISQTNHPQLSIHTNILLSLDIGPFSPSAGLPQPFLLQDPGS